ncbi:hypothetical protein BBP40_000292, partial [Aspergillus hancockii]
MASGQRSTDPIGAGDQRAPGLRSPQTTPPSVFKPATRTGRLEGKPRLGWATAPVPSREARLNRYLWRRGTARRPAWQGRCRKGIDTQTAPDPGGSSHALTRVPAHPDWFGCLPHLLHSTTDPTWGAIVRANVEWSGTGSQGGLLYGVIADLGVFKPTSCGPPLPRRRGLGRFQPSPCGSPHLAGADWGIFGLLSAPSPCCTANWRVPRPNTLGASISRGALGFGFVVFLAAPSVGPPP